MNRRTGVSPVHEQGTGETPVLRWRTICPGSPQRQGGLTDAGGRDGDGRFIALQIPIEGSLDPELVGAGSKVNEGCPAAVVGRGRTVVHAERPAVAR